MGAEREDTDPTAKRTGTEPGLGKASGPTPAAAPAPVVEDESLAPVDFDALHAALGDPLDYQDMGSGPAVEKGTPSDDLLEAIEPTADDEALTGPGVRVGESSGRSSATYASARPHTIPPTRAPNEDPNAPAVIVAADTDTVPSAPPQMTVPLAASPHAAKFAAGGPAGAPPLVPPGSNPHIGAGAGSGPHGAAAPHPGSGPHPAAPPLGVGYPHTPLPIPVQARGGPQMTIRMPDRPPHARRGKTPTIVVRPRGPSTKQRLLAFMAMLLLVTACGIAVIIWRKPHWLGLENLGGAPSATTTSSATPSTTLDAPSPSTSTSSGSGSGPTITPVTPSSGTSAPPLVTPSAKKGSRGSGPTHPLSSAPSNRF